MFKIKNERLYPDLKPMCLSFEIPEGFWIDPCTEVVKPNFIFFPTADKTVSVEITFTYKNCDTTAEKVHDMLESCPKEKLRTVSYQCEWYIWSLCFLCQQNRTVYS